MPAGEELGLVAVLADGLVEIAGETGGRFQVTTATRRRDGFTLGTAFANSSPSHAARRYDYLRRKIDRTASPLVPEPVPPWLTIMTTT